MAAEIIDLTGSPSPPPSMSSSPTIIIDSQDQLQFGRLPVPLWLNNNPNSDFVNTNQPLNAYGCTQLHTHQSSLQLLTPSMAYQPSQAPISFQPNLHSDQVAIVLEPNAYLFPHQTRRMETTWTSTDHELFMMGLNKYGRGRWTKIARHFLNNKTPQQVQSYANSFFKRRNNSTYSNASFSNVVGNNPIFGDASPYNNMMPNLVNNVNYHNYNDEPIRKTLMLFPEKIEPKSFSQLQFQPIGEASTKIANNNYGQVDLELRLGRGQ